MSVGLDIMARSSTEPVVGACSDYRVNPPSFTAYLISW